MSRRVLNVVLVNQNCAYVSGYGSRELITEIRFGRPPVWSAVGRAWVTTPDTARAVIAVAETRKFDVIVTEGDPLPELMGVLF